MNKGTAKQPGAVIYTRVSTGEQAENGTSLEGQRLVCRERALALGLPIVAEYEDAGVSGGLLLARTGMMAALTDIQAGRADTMICANVSRYSCDIEHQQSLLKSVRNAGGRVVFCDLDLADTPEGDLMFSFMGGYAQYERQTIRKRTMSGRRRRAEEGIQPSRSLAPYGYHIPTVADVLRGDSPPELVGRYVVIEEQAAVVRQMFTWYAEGTYSLAHMARELNAAGVPTARGGRIWRCTTIRQMLINPAYKGAATFGRHQHHLDESRIGQAHAQTGKPLKAPKRYGISEDFVTIPCPALVSEELWNQAQERPDMNKKNRSGNPQRLKMLSGLAYCPGCGGRMISIAERTCQGTFIPAHYRCGENVKKQRLEGVRFCDSKTYRQADAEGAVVAALLDALQRPECVELALAAYRQARPAEAEAGNTETELASVERRLAALERQQQAAVKAQIAGIMAGASASAYDAAFADIAAQRQELETRRETLHRANSRAPKGSSYAAAPETWKAAAHDIYRVLTSPQISGADKRQAVACAVERVVCQKGGGNVEFLPGFFGEHQAARETMLSVLTACASYLGL